MKKRALFRLLLVGLLLLTMATSVLALPMVGQPLFPAGDADTPEEAPTRAQWIGQLVELFQMEIEESCAPDNYYSDLDGTEEYYRNILVATDFGVIDLEAGDAFRPMDPVTREFAAQTLNFCLGYRLGEDVQYSFSDAEETPYATDAQVAVNRGWFALEDGKFLPQAPITSEEQSFLLADAREVLENSQIDPDHENKVTVADGILVVPQDTLVAQHTDGRLKIFDTALPLSPEDVFVVYYNDLPLAFRAVSIEVMEDHLLIETSTEGTEHAFEELDYQGSFSAKEAQKHPKKDITYIDDISKDKEFDIVDGLSCSVTGSLTNISLETKLDRSNGEYLVLLKGDTELTVTVEGSVAAALGNETIPLAVVPILYGAGNISLNFEYDIAGEITTTWEGELSAGVSVSPEDGLRLIKSFRKKVFTVSASVSLEAGLRAQVEVDLVVVNAKAWASLGLRGELRATAYSTGTPSLCEDLSAYLYARIGAEISYFSLSSWDMESEEKVEDFYTVTNSPIRLHYHWDDGKRTTVCSRGQNLKYQTPGTSTHLRFKNTTVSGNSDMGGDGRSYGSYIIDNGILNLNGHRLVISGDLFIRGGTIKLNGGTIIVCGNVYHTGGTLELSGGNMTVSGDYYAYGTTEDSQGNVSVTASNGILTMQDANDRLKIEGNLYWNAKDRTTSGNYSLTNGQLTLLGDLTVMNHKTLYMGGSLKVILAGNRTQTIYNTTTYSSSTYFGNLEIQNTKGIVWEGWMHLGNLLNQSAVIEGRDLSVHSLNLQGKTLTLMGHTTVSGTANVQGGKLILSDDSTLTGTLDLGAGSLLCHGDLTQSNGILNLNKGSVQICGDYKIQKDDGTETSSAYFLMRNEEDRLTIEGDLYWSGRNTDYSGNYCLTKGQLTLLGDLNVLHSKALRFGEELTVILAGQEEQTVSNLTAYTSSTYFGTLDVQNPTGVTWEGYLYIGKLLTEETTVTGKDLTIYQLNLDGNSLTVQGEATLSSIVNLQGGKLCFRDRATLTGTLDLQGGSLLCEGDLIHSNGTLNLNGGSAQIAGDYRIQSPSTDEQGELTWTEAPAAYFLMRKEEDSLTIEGDLYWSGKHTDYSGNYCLTDGQLTLLGDLTVLHNKPLRFGEELTVILAGQEEQTVSNLTGYTSSTYFGTLDVQNPTGVIWEGYLYIGKLLTEETTVTGKDLTIYQLNLDGNSLTVQGEATLSSIVNLQGGKLCFRDRATLTGTLDLQGGSLLCKGDLIHSNGTLNLNGGSARIVGDYRIQSPSTDEQGEITWSEAPAAYFLMRKEEDRLTVEGDLYWSGRHTDYSGNYCLTDGQLTLLGDLTVLHNKPLRFGEELTVILAGQEGQTVSNLTNYSSSTYFGTLDVQNPTGVTWEGYLYVGALVSEESTIIGKDLTIYQLNLAGNSLTVQGETTLSSTVNLQGGKLCFRDRTTLIGTLNLESGTLLCEGDLIHSNGSLHLNGGSARIVGDYRVMKESVGEDGALAWEESPTAYILMQNSADRLLVEGDLYWSGRDTTATGNPSFTKGELVLMGDLHILNNKSLYLGGELKTVFAGEAMQTVSNRTNYSSTTKISNLEIRNPAGLLWSGWMHVEKFLPSQGHIYAEELDIYTLNLEGNTLTVHGDFTITGKLSLGGGSFTAEGNVHLKGTANMEGGSVKILGDLIQSTGSLRFSGGTLDISGSYYAALPQRRSELWGMGSAQLSMSAEEDTMIVGKDFLWGSNSTASMSKGTLYIGGDFLSLPKTSLSFQKTHSTILNGTEPQSITFGNSSNQFGTLILTQEESNYSFATEQCWQVLRTLLLDEGLKLGHSLNLASDISVNFVIPKPLLEGYDMSTVYLECTVDLYEGNLRTGIRSFRLLPVEQGDYYYFTLSGLTAVEMNDRISSVLHGTKDGKEYYSHTDSYSIADYAYSQLSKPTSSDALKTLCTNLLRYGAKAQLYKEYRTNALADGSMTEEQRAYLSDLEAVTFGNNNADLGDLASAPITWIGKTLDLDSKVCLKFVFDTSNYTGSLADLRLKVNYKDIYGEFMEVTVTEVTEYNVSRNQYAFSVDALLASELREVVSVQIFAGETPVSSTFRYSADTYGNNKSGTLLELCKALFAYSDSAKTYFSN